ncbi:MAG TPA: histidine phosphatase family protein [Candidatus Saccharimonadia bacterium]|jgi:broad specificity phosphatase PhoE|nr:histidine phosphatase family protein [Candidatus Saccharimonadia bacterium]
MTDPFPPGQPVCTLYLARHGQSKANVDKLFGLDTDLTEYGRQQTRELARVLAGIHVSAVFSSEMARAKETAEIIATERKLAVKTKALLREKHWGSLEGKLKSDVRRDLADLFERARAMSDSTRIKHKVTPDMESEEEMMSRYVTVLREIAAAYREQSVLVISHQTIMRTFLVHLGYVEYSQLPEGSISNTGYIKLLSDGIDFYVAETQGISQSDGWF